MTEQGFRQLDVAVLGGGIGGMATAIALRRAGHKVSIYERRGFDVEVGASISCAANGTQWLHDWNVDVPAGRPVILMELTMRDWDSGEILNQYHLKDYEKTWGNVYNMFHRQDMHRVLMESAISQDGHGPPCTVVMDHIAEHVDTDAGTITFRNGNVVKADLIVGSDGIRSKVRSAIGVTPEITSAPQTCYRCNVSKDEVERLGLSWAADPAIQFWGGYPKDGLNQYYKIVMSPCAGGDIVSFYCFMPTELTKHHEEGFVFKEVPPEEILAGDYSRLDPLCRTLIANSVERKPWRLYVHAPYSHWYKKQTCILGDAAHPMMPHQSQGACQAIEDAAALGIIFSSKYRFTGDVEAGLRLYEQIRKPRATRVQEASARALENLNERIGFSSLNAHDAAVAAKANKLTINEMNTYDMKADIASAVSAQRPSSAMPAREFAAPPVSSAIKADA
ncbi:FAD/NAD(P)-binding domain-containing protein [Testicularia cyperi]|uniref:FAD/NAD(P)-binding domain-containing protein n=1 Tax=Testicularia cyperi TaxID=1882483 RepID=A0A317XF01_9BASI|nr:FAD/NAD(P)-binding domain-containing protein [Testicularia cyperi]